MTDPAEPHHLPVPDPSRLPGSDPDPLPGSDPRRRPGPDPDDADQDGPPLDERIAILTALVGDPSARDPAGLRGLLGTTWLQRYERDGEESALRTGLGYLHDAIGAEPDHEDRLVWWYWLGVAHRELGRVRDSLEDLDSAVYWLGRLLGGLPTPHPDRTALAPEWMDLCTERFALLARERGTDPAALAMAADRLVSELESVRGAPAGYPDMLVGLARLQRYDLAGRRDDLDAGIARLSDVVARLPADTPRLTLARFELADALRTRWQLDGEPADLDTAIARWSALAAEHPDPWIGASCGTLLLDRAVRTADPADATASIALLRRATGAAGGDEPGSADDAWLGWYDLGRAYQVRWQIAAAPEDHAAAQRCLDRALLLGTAGDDLLPLVHLDRLRFAMDGLAHGGDGRPDAARIAMLLAETGPVLDQEGALGPEDRALLAGLLAYAELWVHGTAGIDVGRVHRRIGLARQLPHADDGWLATVGILGDIAGLVPLPGAAPDRPHRTAPVERAAVRRVLPALLRTGTYRSAARSGLSRHG